MKIVEYKAKRLVLTTPEEKAIKESWGTYFSKLKREQDKNGFFNLIIGEWSGYNPNQTKDVHVGYCSPEIFNNSNKYFLGIIEYTDKTTLKVSIRQYTLEKLFSENRYKRTPYTDIIKRLVDSGQKYYILD
jgi:hypothetical protein